MITPVRIARPSLILNGQDFFNQLSPYFLNMSYTDNCDGQKADDFHLQLADRDMRFISDWMPDKGAFIDVSIVTERWFAPNAAGLSLDCGRFWIDAIEFELPQHTVSIKAQSIPTDAHIKASNETRGWDDTTLKDIASQIAGENNMTIDYRSDFNPRYARVEQTEQSGLEFLRHRATDAKLSIKVCRGQIIFYDEQTLEATAPAFTIVYGSAPGGLGQSTYRIKSAHFTTKLTDTTKKATVSHNSPETGKNTKEVYTAQDYTDGVDAWNQNVNEGTDGKDEEDEGDDGNGGGGRRSITPRDSIEPVGDWNNPEGDAGTQRKAKSVVRDANKDKETADIELSLGNPLVAAGMTFNLSGFGKYDGAWFIESAEHTVAPIYETKLNARRCLTGY
jgi:phage protein D